MLAGTGFSVVLNPLPLPVCVVHFFTEGIYAFHAEVCAVTACNAVGADIAAQHIQGIGLNVHILSKTGVIFADVHDRYGGRMKFITAGNGKTGVSGFTGIGVRIPAGGQTVTVQFREIGVPEQVLRGQCVQRAQDKDQDGR